MFDSTAWHANLLPVKANVLIAEKNRSLGLKAWNSRKSPLYHYGDRIIEKLAFESSQFDLPPRTRSTFITAFSPDSSLLASCHGDHQIHILDVKTKSLIKSLVGHERSPWCVTFHPGSNEILASGSLNGEVRVWDLRGDGSESWIVDPNELVAIASLSFHPYDHVLAIAAGNEIHFWDWSLSRPFASVKTSSENEKVRFVRFDPWGHSILTGVANAEEEDDDGSDEPTFDHWSWLFPISRSWQSRSGDTRPSSRFRSRRRNHGSSNYSERSTNETSGSEYPEPRRPTTRWPTSGRRGCYRVNTERESTRNSSNATEALDFLPYTPPVEEQESASASYGDRSNLAQAHQRILHAQVSVNAEIQQQYTRLQMLRQERHRLELRLRELQNSANEVRNSTPLFSREENGSLTSRSQTELFASPYTSSISNAIRAHRERLLNSLRRTNVSTSSATNERTSSSGTVVSTTSNTSTNPSLISPLMSTGTTSQSNYGAISSSVTTPIEIRPTMQLNFSSASSSSPVNPPSPSLLSLLSDLPMDTSPTPSPLPSAHDLWNEALGNPGSPYESNLMSLANTAEQVRRNSPTLPTSGTSRPNEPDGDDIIQIELPDVQTSATFGNMPSISQGTGNMDGFELNFDVPVDERQFERASESIRARFSSDERRNLTPAQTGLDWLDQDRSGLNRFDPTRSSFLPEYGMEVLRERDRLWGHYDSTMDSTTFPRDFHDNHNYALPGFRSLIRAHTPSSGQNIQHINPPSYSSIFGPTSSRSHATSSEAPFSAPSPIFFQGAFTPQNQPQVSRTSPITTPTSTTNSPLSYPLVSSSERATPSLGASGTGTSNGSPSHGDPSVLLEVRERDTATSQTGATSNLDPTSSSRFTSMGTDLNLNLDNAIAEFLLSDDTESSSMLEPLPEPHRNSGLGATVSSSITLRNFSRPSSVASEDTRSQNSNSNSSGEFGYNWDPNIQPSLATTVQSAISQGSPTVPQRSPAEGTTQSANIETQSGPQGSPSQQGTNDADESTLGAQVADFLLRRSHRLISLGSGNNEDENEQRVSYWPRELPPSYEIVNRGSSSQLPSSGVITSSSRRILTRTQPSVMSIPTTSSPHQTSSSTRSTHSVSSRDRRASTTTTQEIRSPFTTRRNQDSDLTSETRPSTDRRRQHLMSRVWRFVHEEPQTMEASELLSDETDEPGSSRRTSGFSRNLQSSSMSQSSTREPSLQGPSTNAIDRNLSRIWSETSTSPTATRPTSRGVYNALRQQRQIRLNRRHMRSNINRIISSVYAENNGHRAVVLNIDNTTYRLQWWDFTQLKLPEISRSDINVIVPHCKIYNDASIDISKDGQLLATFVPTFVGYPDNMMNVCIFSLEPSTFGQLLFKKAYGPNAVCLSLSPLNNYICVGLKSKQFLLGEMRPNRYLMAQILELTNANAEMPVVRHVHYHPAQDRPHRLVSINTVAWIPEPGRGVIYGTNNGDLSICETIAERNTEEYSGFDAETFVISV